MPDDEKANPKDTAYYSALLSAWIQSRMERDRTLITLSSAGIGLLLTLSSTVGPNSKAILALYCLGFLGFTVAIFSCLHIYQRNSRHIERQLTEPPASDPTLSRFDRLSWAAFFLGVASVVGIGILSAIIRLMERGVTT